uniref:DNA repair protein RecN n=1 Tax=Prevotellamassilia timonensis TaxID=1852370 RepID=UPI004038A8B6
MLHHLTISHYALIEHLDIDFNSGFTVITGQTGAGKSIMLGALNLLLGGRADAKSIQSGEKKCTVEASFNIENLGLESFFARNDIDFDATDCIIRREVLQSGKSRAFINDTPVPAAKLKEIGASLLDIHSQHQNLLIRNEHFLIDTLDIIAAHPQAVSDYKCLYGQCKQAEQVLSQLQERSIKGRTDQEYLTFQLNQIDEAQLQPEEQDALENDQHRRAHAEDIKQAFYQAKGLLNTDEMSLSQNLRQAAETLEAISDNYPEATDLAERLRSVRIEVEDIEAEVESKAEDIEYDPQRLNYVEERLNIIYELEQKHNATTIADVLDIAEKLRLELDSIENIEEDIKKQQAEVERLRALRNKLAAQLSKERKAAAKIMEQELIKVLTTLGMPNARMEMQITPRTAPDVSGNDNVIFLFSANKNVPLQDVSAIASGGEIARMMLALKSLIAKRTNLPTIVFDEIDTGVSGTMAECMAQVMQGISANCQVICITHLPQIAARGAHHMLVYKEDSEGFTRSHIIPLTQAQRVEEIAHMLSGSELTDAAIDNAKALMAQA